MHTGFFGFFFELDVFRYTIDLKKPQTLMAEFKSF